MHSRAYIDTLPFCEHADTHQHKDALLAPLELRETLLSLCCYGNRCTWGTATWSNNSSTSWRAAEIQPCCYSLTDMRTLQTLMMRKWHWFQSKTHIFRLILVCVLKDTENIIPYTWWGVNMILRWKSLQFLHVSKSLMQLWSEFLLTL